MKLNTKRDAGTAILVCLAFVSSLFSSGVMDPPVQWRPAVGGSFACTNTGDSCVLARIRPCAIRDEQYVEADILCRL